ncbi:MAG: DUF2804 family protein [Spirochaetota bacterium]
MGAFFTQAPHDAVTDGDFSFGWFRGPFERVNFLDIRRFWRRGTPGWIKTWRLKEWRAFLMGDARWSVMTALFNAKLFTIAYFHAWDRQEGRSVGFTRILPGNIVAIGEKLTLSHNAYHGQHARVDFDFNLSVGIIAVSVNWKPGKGLPGFHGAFTLPFNMTKACPTSVVMPLGGRRAMYSTKIVLPMEGSLDLAGSLHRFDPRTASALVIDHKGFYPFGFHYDWIGAVGIDAAGRRVGFSLAASSNRAAGAPVHAEGSSNENCVWIGERAWSLPSVRITRAAGYQGDWVIQDTEGLVDLLFTPKDHSDISFHLGLVESDWHGPFGALKGTVKNGEGETIEAERLVAMGEDMYLRA